MNRVISRFTVYFEEPFWVGVCECVWEGRRTAARVVFGAEPRDCEVYEYLLHDWSRLRFGPPVAAGEVKETRISPKRMQRRIAAELSGRGGSTRAQQALSLSREEAAEERKTLGRQTREQEEARKFRLRRQKKKEKHRGR